MGFFQDLKWRAMGREQARKLDRDRAMYYQLRGIPYDEALYSGKRELSFEELKTYYVDVPQGEVAKRYSEFREEINQPGYEPQTEAEKMAFDAAKRYGKEIDERVEYVRTLKEQEEA